MGINCSYSRDRENAAVKRTTKKNCPLVQDPLGDCYCFKMGSQDIEKAVFFCSKYYEFCEIYKINFLKSKGVSISA